MKKLFYILSLFFFSIQSFGQANNFVLTIDSAKHFSVGSFVSHYQGEKIENFDYRENTYATSDGGTGTLLRIEDSESSIRESNYFFDAKLFPNPTTGSFSIKTNANQPMSVFIFDLLGNLVFQSTGIETQYATINLTNYSKGIYFVKTVCEGNFNVSRIIVQ